MKVQKRHIKRWAIIGFNRFLIELLLIFIPITLEKRFNLEMNGGIKLALIIAILVLTIEKIFERNPKYNKITGSIRTTVFLLGGILFSLFKLYGIPTWLMKSRTQK